MPTKATTLFSLNRFKEFVKATGASHDDPLIRIADGVSDRVESYSNRFFVSRSVTETRSGNDTNRMQLRHYPVSAVTSAKYRFSLLDAFVVIDVPTELELDGFKGVVYLKQLSWPKGARLVEIVYTAGFGAQDDVGVGKIPGDVFYAALEYGKLAYDRWKSDMVSVSSVSAQSAGYAVGIPDMPKDLQGILKGYLKHRI